MQPLYFRSSPGVGQAIHGYFLRTSMDDGVHEPVDLMYLSEEDVKSMLESLGCNTKVNRRKMRLLIDNVRKEFGFHGELQMSQQYEED